MAKLVILVNWILITFDSNCLDIQFTDEDQLDGTTTCHNEGSSDSRNVLTETSISRRTIEDSTLSSLIILLQDMSQVGDGHTCINYELMKCFIILELRYNTNHIKGQPVFISPTLFRSVSSETIKVVPRCLHLVADCEFDSSAAQ